MNAGTQSQARPLAAITGASSGIGAAYSEKLARRGYDLLLIARRKERLDDLAGQWGARYACAVEPMVADLAQDSDIARVAERLRSDPRLEFLVNNAGFGTLRFFHDEPLASQDAMHQVHIMATMRLTHAALSGMVARRKGFIVNVSSVSGFMFGPGVVSYSATKAWMNSFSLSLAMEMDALGMDVRVQALCPGFTKTEFHATLGTGRSFARESWWMTAEDVVDASLAGLGRRKVIVIPGLRYQFIVFLLKHLPVWVIRRAARRAPNVERGQAPPASP
jgi:hypothetical protein